jgi:hypothetical protein
MIIDYLQNDNTAEITDEDGNDAQLFSGELSDVEPVQEGTLLSTELKFKIKHMEEWYEYPELLTVKIKLLDLMAFVHTQNHPNLEPCTSPK